MSRLPGLLPLTPRARSPYGRSPITYRSMTPPIPSASAGVPAGAAATLPTVSTNLPGPTTADMNTGWTDPTTGRTGWSGVNIGDLSFGKGGYQYNPGQNVAPVQPTTSTGPTEPIPYTYGTYQDYPQYPTAEWSFPMIVAMMQSLGFEATPNPLKTGEGRYTWKKTTPGDYNVQAVNQQLAGTRDVGERELQRQLGSMQESLGERGMGDSSVAAGGEAGLRGEFVTDQMRQRQQLVQQERIRFWQQLMNVIQMANQSSGALAGGKPQPVQAEQDSGTDWGFLGDIGSIISLF